MQGQKRRAFGIVPKDGPESARRWRGFGTATKPAYEPWVVARKPLSESSVARQVLANGCGALNIEASRVGTTKDVPASVGNPRHRNGWGMQDNLGGTAGFNPNSGRWPANVILSCCGEEPHLEGCPVAEIDAQSGVSRSPASYQRAVMPTNNVYGMQSRTTGATMNGHGDTGGASRFFYCAKASRRERNAGLEGKEDGVVNSHPT
jgi:hypothetical protein